MNNRSNLFNLKKTAKMWYKRMTAVDNNEWANEDFYFNKVKSYVERKFGAFGCDNVARGIWNELKEQNQNVVA